MGKYRRGVSQQVRKTVIVPSLELNPLIAEPSKVTSFLGFKGKAEEHARVREQIQEQYAGMYTL